MEAAAEDFVLSCPDYHQLKPGNTPQHGLLQRLPIPEQIWTDVIMHFVVRLPEAKGCDSIDAVVDTLSKYAHFIPCSRSVRAEEVAQFFGNHV